MIVHLNRPSGQPRPGASALCGADNRHGVSTTYTPSRVNCAACLELKIRDDATYRSAVSADDFEQMYEPAPSSQQPPPAPGDPQEPTR